MASPDAMVTLADAALKPARAVVEEHGTEERIERLRAYFPAMPAPRNVEHFAAYQCELIAGLAEIVDKLVNEAKPRPRGRPRKQKD